MIGQCELYRIQAELRQSHLIPKFAFDYLKKTGGRYLRTYENPNQRVQDAPKTFMLSEKAEQEFSKRERWFANNIFYPYMGQKKTRFNYSEDFAYFIVSLLWRVIKDQLKHSVILNNENLEFLKEVEAEWHGFLSAFQFPINYNDLNVFLTDRVSSHNTKGIDINLYLTRAIDATIVANDKYTNVGVYVKFLRFIFWSVVKGNPNNCPDVKVQFHSGTLKIPQELSDDFIGNFINNRIEQFDNRPKPSEAQQKIISDEMLNCEDSFWTSDGGQAMLKDFEMQNAQ